MSKKEEVKPVKVKLKLSRPHQRGFRIGRYLITPGAAQEVELNEAEQAELKGKGPKHWLTVDDGKKK